MNGLGFFAWQLTTIRDVYTPEQLAQLLSKSGVKWISWKLANGIYPYNQIDGSDDLLIEYMQALEDIGITNGGWSYNYPEKPGTQAALISERIATFSSKLVSFEHWMLDIETEWKKTGLNANIDALLNISKPLGFPVGFCSYRYPKLHPPLNFSRFLNNPTITFNAPQVYWMGMHDPARQLDESYNQYAALTDKPFIPIGAAWGQMVGDAYWEPTRHDLTEFVVQCLQRGWNTYGFWSLDWIVKKQRFDMLEAISGISVTPPPPYFSTHVVTIQTCNPRTRPALTNDSDAGAIIKGAVFEKAGEKSSGFQPVKMWLHESMVEDV